MVELKLLLMLAAGRGIRCGTTLAMTAQFSGGFFRLLSLFVVMV
jgi:hypothetical protein